MYETYDQPMLSRRAFAMRLARHFSLTLDDDDDGVERSPAAGN